MDAITLMQVVMVTLFFENATLVQKIPTETTLGVCNESKMRALDFNSRHKDRKVSVYVSCFLHPKDKKA